MTLLDEIVAEEGCVPHLYLDTRGNVTCGVGRLIRKSGELGNYAWSDFNAALRDFSTLQQMARDCKYGAKWPASRYRTEGPMLARMLNPREGLAESIEAIDKALTKRIPGLEQHPVSVQEALIDMAYNLGVDGLVKGYPKMLTALAVPDYVWAADECHRNGVSSERNRRTAERILKGNTLIGSRPGRGA